MINVSVNAILKIQPRVVEYDLVQIKQVSLGKLPIIYTKLYDNNKLSINEYNLIKRIWESDKFNITDTLSGLISWFFDTKSVDKYLRNSFNSSIIKLANYGLIKYEKPEFREISIELSVDIFGKLESYYSRYLKCVDLFYVVYLREINENKYCEYAKFCEDIGVTPLKQNSIEYIQREALIGLRSPVLGLRESIIGLRKPIIDHKSNDYFPNKRTSKINFNAKKYEGLTDNEKRQLESLSKFGQAYVDRKLKQMRKNQFSVADKLEMDCIDNFVPYYENLICKATGRLYYSLLPNQKKKSSRNWTSIFKCYKLCLDNGYDWKIYLEAQFEAFKHWNNVGNLKYPAPNNLCSERAIKAYENYIYHNETAYQNEGWETTVSSKKVGSPKEELEKIISTDLSIIKNVIDYSLKKSFNKTFKNVDKSRSDLDTLYYSKAVQQSWEDLSIEFWSLIPQMNDFLDRVYGNYSSLDAKIDLYDELMENSKKKSLIREVAYELNIPKLYGIIIVDDKMK